MSGGSYTTPILFDVGSDANDGYSPETFPYFCMVHPWMIGEVIITQDEFVAEANAIAQEPEPTPATPLHAKICAPTALDASTAPSTYALGSPAVPTSVIFPPVVVI